MAKLFLQRHLKSQWNLEDRYAGWVDNPLSDEGLAMADDVAKLLQGETFDVIFTSPLSRNQQTTLEILKRLGLKPLFMHLDGGKRQEWGHFEGDNGTCVPAYVSEKINERYYGKLQGLNKEESKKTYGEDQVKLWRRSWDIQPPEGESLKDTFERTIPFFKEFIEPKLKEGKNVLVVSSGNSLRSIVKHIENITDDKIIEYEIKFGGLVKYEFDGLSGTYVKL
jgi:2,3-bisphosphoglycerate-dependent phosphoglycerate mutase